MGSKTIACSTRDTQIHVLLLHRVFAQDPIAAQTAYRHTGHQGSFLFTFLTNTNSLTAKSSSAYELSSMTTFNKNSL